MEKKRIFALGFFDGVHLGHQALLLACRNLAEKHGYDSGVVTFTTHPDGLVAGNTPRLLNTVEDRRLLLYGYKMDSVAEFPFDEKLMRTHWSAFLEMLLDAGGAGFVCGSDFRFGAGGSGTAEKLAAFCEKRNLPYEIVPQQEIEGIRVSSTYIRELIETGEMARANTFLGHPQTLTGEVVSGRGLGHTIGVPTANLNLPEGVVCPKRGVYACKAIADGKEYLAVTNVGTRPTVSGNHLSVERWLLDFEGDLYGKPLRLFFYKFLRPEKEFASLAELKAEIQRNAEEVCIYFR